MSKSDFKGGIINHGDFIEGFCFQIHTKNKQNKEIVWELCTKTKVNTLIILQFNHNSNKKKEEKFF